uniref:EF-hand domain-containing protein n=1 Tax=Mesocestoides corti TaxID=53468 RepID=A0A5K3EI20_MESCO
MASTKTKKRVRSRTQRYTSNVFSMFTEAQINEFKEAFSLIDGSKDGIIDQGDLEEVFRSMGKNPTEAYLEEMLKQAPGCINFTMFLTLFGEKMMGCDPEDTILNAFAQFDPNNKGIGCEATFASSQQAWCRLACAKFIAYLAWINTMCAGERVRAETLCVTHTATCAYVRSRRLHSLLCGSDPCCSSFTLAYAKLLSQCKCAVCWRLGFRLSPLPD